jgi:hypothetical protein
MAQPVLDDTRLEPDTRADALAAPAPPISPVVLVVAILALLLAVWALAWLP